MPIVLWKDKKRELMAKHGDWIRFWHNCWETLGFQEQKKLHKQCKKRGIPFSLIRSCSEEE